MRYIFPVIGVGLLIIFFMGFVPKMLNQKELDRMEKATVGAVKSVRTVTAAEAPNEETGNLPGSISAIQYATIYARVDGYLKSRLVDIGDHVKAGQLLAEIETPTVDEEVAQAQAQLAQANQTVASARATVAQSQATAQAAEAQVKKAQSNQEYTQITATRWERMAAKGAVSLQSRDEKDRANAAQRSDLKEAEAQKTAADQAVMVARSQVSAALAEVKAKEASLNRYRATQAFKFVRAPFDGVITLRKVDPGALITSGSGSTSLELFQLAKIDDLRIYINAPQSVSRYLKSGQSATVLVAEYPDRTFSGSITNLSGGLDPQTRTRQTEIHIDNRDHTLLPGMYAQVKLVVERNDPWIKINSNAMVPRDNETQVVVVADNKAHYQKVSIGRDFGDLVEIKSGLKAGDVVVVNPPIDLRDGEAVSAVPLDSH